jgi:hypothetical protein
MSWMLYTLADSYQWSQRAALSKVIVRSQEIVGAEYLPHPQMPDRIYRLSYNAWIEGTLQLDKEDTSQLVQSTRSPVQLEGFVANAIKAAQANEKKLPGGNNVLDPGGQ